MNKIIEANSLQFKFDNSYQRELDGFMRYVRPKRHPHRAGYGAFAFRIRSC